VARRQLQRALLLDDRHQIITSVTVKVVIAVVLAGRVVAGRVVMSSATIT
jgi:hypothetical protein